MKRGSQHVTAVLLSTLLCAFGFAQETTLQPSLRERIDQYDWAGHSAAESVLTTDSIETGPSRDVEGLKRDTLYFFGYQVATIGILYLMPEGLSGWSEESKDEYSISRWADNVSRPTWDEDDYFLNYVMHPYWGASYYVRARERGFGRRSAFWYATLLSTSYEFGVEALFEQPSIQDLIVTPIAGAVLGDYFFRLRQRTLAGHAQGNPITLADRWVLALSDPLGAMNERVERVFGRKAQLTVAPFVNRSANPGFFFGRQQSDNVFGMEIKVLL